MKPGFISNRISAFVRNTIIGSAESFEKRLFMDWRNLFRICPSSFPRKRFAEDGLFPIMTQIKKLNFLNDGASWKKLTADRP